MGIAEPGHRRAYFTKWYSGCRRSIFLLPHPQLAPARLEPCPEAHVESRGQEKTGNNALHMSAGSHRQGHRMPPVEELPAPAGCVASGGSAVKTTIVLQYT